jgi:hypothetical protein
MGVLTPAGNGVNLLRHKHTPEYCNPADNSLFAYSSVALTAKCDSILWHRRFGQLNKQSLQAQHTHGAPTTPALSGDVINVYCDFCLLHKASGAPATSLLSLY